MTTRRRAIKPALELRHLRAFVSVAEHEHVTRAAARLRIAQPALTRQMQQLEAAVGVPLLARSGRGVQLTPAGRAFLEDARALLAQSAAAVGRATDVHLGRGRLLRIGFIEVASASGLLPEAMRRFSEASPGVRFELRELTTVGQLAALQARELDVGFGCSRSVGREVGLCNFTVLSDPLVGVLRRGHRLARQRRLGLAALDGEPLLLVRRQLGPDLFADITEALSKAGVVADHVQEVSQFQTIVQLAAAGVGIGIVPRSLATAVPPGAVVRPFAGLAARHDTELLQRDGDADAVVEAFVAICRRAARDLQDDVKRTLGEREAAAERQGRKAGS